MKKTLLKIAVATAFTLPMGAQATIFQFNASLNGANERPSPVATTAFGLATLHYDDKGTVASLLDDTFSVAVSGFGLSGAPTGFHIGVSINPAAHNLDEELRRFEYKVEAGAEFVITRPVFDVAAFERLLKRIEHARLPVIAGVFPFESARNAEFMANEVPGVRVPDALIDRMRGADGAEAATSEGVAIARAIALELRPAVQGVQVSTPAGDTDAALAVLDGLR